MSLPEIASRAQWLVARRRLLDQEKRFTRERDGLNAERRRLPMVAVETDYRFSGPAGTPGSREQLPLQELFAGRQQLVVYHAMWLYDQDRPCPSCSAFLDQIGHLAHLAVRDTAFAAVTRAPAPVLARWRERLGWSFPWYSSHGSRFNYDFHVTFDEGVAPIEYNYLSAEELVRRGLPLREWEQPFDLHGLSVFLREDERVFHTYSTYARGTDNLGFISDLLDLTPLGRQEAWEEPQGRARVFAPGAGQPAVLYHDEY